MKINPLVSRRLVAITGAALILTSIAAASIWAMNTRRGSIESAKSVLRPSPPNAKPVDMTQGSPSGNSDGPVQVVRFTLYDVGILPRQARVSKGMVAVTLKDLSGEVSGVIVERQNKGSAPERAWQVSRHERDQRASSMMKLEPGIYDVFDAENPEHRAQLIVEQ